MSSLKRLNWNNAVSYYVDRHLDEGRGDKTIFYYRDQTISYYELYQLTRKAGSVFAVAGIDYENRVVLILPDCPNFVIAFFGLMLIGAVPVPLSYRLALDDYLYMFADCRPKAAVVTREHIPFLEQIRDELAQRNLPFPQSIWVIDDDVPPSGYQSFEESLRYATSDVPVCMTSIDDMALIQYTSGSTGVPKGVVHLHRGLLAVCESIVPYLNMQESDIFFSAAKLSFGYGLGNSILFPLSCAGSAILLSGLADPYNVYDVIKRGQPTILFGVPSLYSAMLNVPRCETEFDLSGLRLCVSAGEHLSANLFQKWKTTFGHEIIEGIGSTECLHIFICNEVGRIKPGSTGRPIENVEARLIDDKGQLVSPGEAGTLYIKAKFNAARYWNKQDETSSTMVGQWTRTGDLFYQDEDGYFLYIGRDDDVIKVGGLKVSPIEIEEFLLAHESVGQCAVVSSTQEDGTTSIAAYICLRAGYEPTQALKGKLKEFMRGSLSAHKIPRLISFVEDLPMTTTGKIARYKLR